ncbi:MAG: aldehyde dehydrogenase [Solirubrobacteraceae bacterium]
MATGSTTTIATSGMFIDGEHREAVSGEILDVLNPATGEVIAQIPAGGSADVDLAVASAQAAYDGGWSSAPATERAAVINRLGDLIDEHLPELFALETRNNGRPLVETRAQLSRASEIFRYYAALAVTQRGETIDMGADYHAYLQRMPLGVCAGIVPFNHPLLILTRCVAPALASGNTIVAKPSEITPLTALRVAELGAEAGLPAGAFNVITGLGLDAGAPLVNHPDVKKVDFTGGVETGRSVAVAAASRFANYTAELGGKSPVLVFADAGIETAAKGVAFGGFVAAGQTCICGSRVVVEDSIYDEFVAALIAQAEAIRIGDPSDPATQMGPLVSAVARDRSAEYVRIAIEEGATVATGGRPPELEAPFHNGFFFSPTVISDAANDMRCAQEEIFGPVLTVARFSDEADAIRQANDIPFGLGAAVWTRDVARAHRVSQQIESGMVWVNDHHRAGPTMPWGGVKDSGSGKQSGREAFDDFTTVKAIVVRTAAGDVDWYGATGAQRRLN